MAQKLPILYHDTPPLNSLGSNKSQLQKARLSYYVAVKSTKTKFKPVLVLWHDAYSIDTWTDIEALKKENSCLVHSVGFLIEQDKKKIILALNHDTANDNASCVMVIPKDMVQSIVSLDK